MADGVTGISDQCALSHASLIRQLYQAVLRRPPTGNDIEHYSAILRSHDADQGVQKIATVLGNSTEFKMSRSNELLRFAVGNPRLRTLIDTVPVLVRAGVPADAVPDFDVLPVEHPNWKRQLAFIASEARALDLATKSWLKATLADGRLTLQGDGAPETFVLKNNRYQLDTETLAADRLADEATRQAWAVRREHDGIHYRAPRDLEVAPTRLKRVMLVGACMTGNWSAMFEHLEPGCVCERVLFNNTQILPARPTAPLADYDFQMVVLPFRAIVPEHSWFRLRYEDDAAYDTLFAECCARIALFLPQALRWNIEHNLLSFVGNFLTPQQSAMGRLLPRRSLKNPVHFVERLNDFLVEQLASLTNCYLLDLDQISATFGRKFIQDDAFWVSTHGSPLSDFDYRFDRQRLEPVDSLIGLFTNRVEDFIFAVWQEMKSMLRTVRQADQVKLVVMDLDDTLWRGVLAESEEISPYAIEGWPLGVAEALLDLRRRGVLLAIVSKNDESTIRRLWNRVFSGRLQLDDFAFVSINWRPKADNIRDVIRQANLLATSVVFVDDNPVERAAVLAGVPGIRVIGQNQHYLKRILLWSAETQVASISHESANRTEMIQQQVKREAVRGAMTRSDFLGSLRLQVETFAIDTARDPAFERAVELLNKTNQFNTSGRRWSRDELARAMAAGLHLLAFSVRDVHVEYGLVGLVLHERSRIEQVVMSCRVFGLEVEAAVIAQLVAALRGGGNRKTIKGVLIPTAANAPCRTLYADAGFVAQGEIWVLPPNRSPAMPAHVEMQTRRATLQTVA